MKDRKIGFRRMTEEEVEMIGEEGTRFENHDPESRLVCNDPGAHRSFIRTVFPVFGLEVDDNNKKDWS